MCEHMLQFHIVKALLPDMDGFPSGQRGQTVNLLQIASVVRIHLHPFALMSSMEQCLARKSMQSSITQCVRWCGGIGRRKGLKIPRGQLRAGSSPATSMNERVGETLILQRFSYFRYREKLLRPGYFCYVCMISGVNYT